MDFPSNSHKVTESNKPKAKVDKKIEKVTTGIVMQKKPGLGKRFKAIFFGGEFKSASKYITSDVLLPALKNLVVDATSRGVERMVYGDSGPRRRHDTQRARVSYNNPIDRGFSRPRPGSVMLPDQPPYHNSRSSQTVGDIILSSRSEAELVIERLADIIDKFDVVSIADLYELVGLPSSYIDNTWGWTNLAYVNVRQTREGYVIDLPVAEAL